MKQRNLWSIVDQQMAEALLRRTEHWRLVVLLVILSALFVAWS